MCLWLLLLVFLSFVFGIQGLLYFTVLSSSLPLSSPHLYVYIYIYFFIKDVFLEDLPKNIIYNLIKTNYLNFLGVTKCVLTRVVLTCDFT